MKRAFDLIVIGGGPAGASAAITAAREGWSVLLIERGRIPRHKVCGEFVSAESLELLRWLLGSAGDALTQNAIQLTQTRLFLDGRVLCVPVNPPSASIARYDLDFALWNAAGEAGATTLSEVTVQAVSREQAFRVVTTAGQFTCRAVINASGRWSNLTRPSNRGTGARWLGIKAHYRGEMEPSVELYFFQGGYCGVQPVSSVAGDPMVNICALVRPGVADSVGALLLCHPLLEDRSRGWQAAFPALRTFPVVFRRPTPVSGSILNTGDAANFVDPFVGDGIAIALGSGHLAARSLFPYLRSECSLGDAIRGYATGYQSSLGSVYRTSSTLRRLLAVPRLLRTPFLIACERNPRLAEYLIKSTRHRAQFEHAVAASTMM